MGLLSKSTSNQLSKKEILELSKDFDLTTTQIQDLFTHYSQVINNISNAKRQTAGQWITNKVFATLFNLGDDSPLPTFRNYVEKLLQWKSNTQIDRIDFFFSVLDYDQDGVINQSDLSIFIFQKSGYKVKFN
ncbi:hypothetical protein BC833DRAFT_417654 [Globomyces pollinis-pini]|nr:hypothetical protein BC833DRAFT_417654 [Globomyces pollinis-pini]